MHLRVQFKCLLFFQLNFLDSLITNDQLAAGNASRFLGRTQKAGVLGRHRLSLWMVAQHPLSHQRNHRWQRADNDN